MNKIRLIFIVLLIFQKNLLASSCPDPIEGVEIDPVAQIEANDYEVCLSGSFDCIFPINKSKATQLAKESGFRKGKDPWKYNINWNFSHGYYVWSISNTITKSKYHSRGEVIEINIETGTVCPGGYWTRDV